MKEKCNRCRPPRRRNNIVILFNEMGLLCVVIIQIRTTDEQREQFSDERTKTHRQRATSLDEHFKLRAIE